MDHYWPDTGPVNSMMPAMKLSVLDVTGKVAVYSTGPVERRCAKRQMPITLVPAEEYWTGTVPAVVPIPGQYWPSTTMFTGVHSKLVRSTFMNILGNILVKAENS